MGAKILVVEDEAALRRAYHQILRLEGFDVSVAEDGAVALKRLRADPPDLVLLDILMPRMDGLEFLRRSHIKEKYPHTKVVAFSNLSGESKLGDMFRLGASQHLLKASLSPRELVETIHKLLAPNANTKTQVSNSRDI